MSKAFAPSWLRRRFVLLALFLTVLMPACGNGAGGPEEAAEDWFVAINADDTYAAEELTCVPLREELRAQLEAGSGLAQLGQALFAGLDVEREFVNMRYTVVEQTEATAIVELTGEMQVTVNGSPDSFPMQERWTMVLEDNAWRWCGQTFG